MRVALVGMMASGKTTVGRMVAEELGWPFVDNDAALRQRTGRGAREIEDEDGLDALHAAEAETLLASLDEGGPAVVAAAASTIEDPACREALRRRAFVVWVEAPPAQIAAKVAKSDERPRTDDDIEALAAERAPHYRALAHLVVGTAKGQRHEAADAVVAAARERFGL